MNTWGVVAAAGAVALLLWGVYRAGRRAERSEIQAATHEQTQRVLSEVDAAREAIAAADDDTLRDSLRRD